MAGSSKGDVVIVIDDDDAMNDVVVPNSKAESRKRKAEEVQQKLEKTLPPYWEIPPGGDAGEYALVEIFDSVKPINNGYLKEILEVIAKLEKARSDAVNTHDQIPFSFERARTARYFTIGTLKRIQNKLHTDMHNLLVASATRTNEKRDPGDKASVMERDVLHGTHERHALSFAKEGPKCVRNQLGAYGVAVYLSALLSIPAYYAFINGIFPEKSALVMGKSLVGRNDQTYHGRDVPNTGFDTGGCGNDWILAVFSDHAFNPEYILVIVPATEQEWKDQVKMFKDADAAVIPRAAAVVGLKSILKAPKPSSEAAALAQVWPQLSVLPPPAVIPRTTMVKLVPSPPQAQSAAVAAQAIVPPPPPQANPSAVTTAQYVNGVWTCVTSGGSSSSPPGGGSSSSPPGGGSSSSPPPKKDDSGGGGGGSPQYKSSPPDSDDPGDSVWKDPTWTPGKRSRK